MVSGSLLLKIVSISFIWAVFSGPCWIWLAKRMNLVDVGIGELKRQQQPVPYLGGLLIVVATSVGLATGGAFYSSILPIWIGAVAVALLGLLDDAICLNAATKILGQITIAVYLSTGDYAIRLQWFNNPIDPGLTILWIVALMNAFNFLDVVDGLCAVISAVIAMILFVFSIMTDSNDAALCATLTASIIGFIRFNWRPARMYLGDSGSMFLGLLLAVISLRLDWTGSNFIAGIVSPLAVLAIPLFELCFVVGSRLRLSLPLHKGSPDHSAIRLLMHGFSIDTIAYLGMGVTLLSGMAGILVAMGNATSASIVGAMGAGGCCVAGVWLWRLKPMRKKAAKAFASSRTIYHGEE